MEIEIERKNDRYQLESIASGNLIDITASPDLAGEPSSGYRPMELLLSALGSCMSIDILNILYKQRQFPSSFKVKVKGRRSEEVPTVFTHIKTVVYVRGPIDGYKLERAIKLSEESYCSVYHMLSPKVEISTTYQLIDD